MFNIYYSYTYPSRNVDDHSLCSTQTNLYHSCMCYSSNAYILGDAMKISAYKNYDDIPTSISDYVLSVTDADNIVEVSIEDINSFLNDQEVYHEYSIQTEGTK